MQRQEEKKKEDWSEEVSQNSGIGIRDKEELHKMDESRKDFDLPQFHKLWVGNGSEAKVIDILDDKSEDPDHILFRIVPLGPFEAINKVDKKDKLPGNELVWKIKR